MPTPSRSRSEVDHDILLGIRNRGGIPTRVMYHANMSWHPLQKRLAIYLEKGWVLECEAGGSDKRRKVRYELTDLGKTVLLALSRNRGIVEGTGALPLDQEIQDLVTRIDELEERVAKGEDFYQGGLIIGMKGRADLVTRIDELEERLRKAEGVLFEHRKDGPELSTRSI